MNRKMYWGVALLILLIGTAAVFMLTRTTETEPVTVYNPLTEADKKQVEQNIQDAIDKEKQNLPPIAEEDRQQVEIEKPQAAEKPQVTEVSKGTGKRVEDMTDEELRNSFSHHSPAELERWKKVDLAWYEQLEELVPKLEKNVKSYSEGLQRNPDSKYYRHMYEQGSRSLKHQSAIRARLKRMLEVVHNVK